MELLNEVIKVFLTALTPIGELRASIPLGLTIYNLPLWLVFIVSVVGNIIPPIFILWLFPKISDWMMSHSKLMNRFLSWLFDRTRKKAHGKIEKYGDIALIIFVAIPLPNTGAWTGALAAWLFDIPMKRAIPNILYGVIIAGVIVTLVTTGLVHIFS
ncbi:putative small multi-drug export protein [bacterium BMS3Abin03]|nr:putative small multi-drug export protein [bacterium BMS3Abin03]